MPYRIALPPDLAAKVGKDAIEDIPDEIKPEQVKAQVLAKYGGQPAARPAQPQQYDPRRDPFAGGVSGYLAGNVRRNLPEIAATAASGAPGPSMLVPPLLAAGATYAAEKAMGSEDPGAKAARSGFEALAGSVLGKVGGAATRVAKAAFDRTLSKVASAIGSTVPEFRGKTPEGTIGRIVSGEGMRDAGTRYREEMARLVKTFGNPPISLTSIPETGPAMDVMKRVNRELNRAFKRKDGPGIDLMHRAQEEFQAKLADSWPKEAQLALQEINRDYAKALEITKLFTGGKVAMTPSQLEKVTSEGRLNVPELQALFTTRKAALQRALGENFPALEEALMRGEANPLARDIPGQGLSIGGHLGPSGGHAYVRHLPRAPRLAGEGPTPQEVSAALQALAPSAFGEIAQGVTP